MNKIFNIECGNMMEVKIDIMLLKFRRTRLQKNHYRVQPHTPIHHEIELREMLIQGQGKKFL